MEKQKKESEKEFRGKKTKKRVFHVVLVVRVS